VSSYDFDADNYITLFVEGTAPGEHAMAPAPVAPPPKSGTNVPKDD